MSTPTGRGRRGRMASANTNSSNGKVILIALEGGAGIRMGKRCEITAKYTKYSTHNAEMHL